jgi:Xaa-Pro aminopeptidase
MGAKTGTMSVDWEQRIDFDRLRKGRLDRARQAMEKHDLGAFVVFQQDNIRYLTARYIGKAGIADRVPMEYCVLCRGQEPILYTWLDLPEEMPWMRDRIRRASTWVRQTVPEAAVKPFAEEWIKHLNRDIKAAGLEGSKVGFDILDVTHMEALKDANFKVVDGLRPLMEARQIKTAEEIEIYRQCATLTSAGFWAAFEALKPGVRECELFGAVTKALYSLGSEYVDCLSCSGPHTNPNIVRHTDRIIDWGDLVFVDIVHQYLGYQTCTYKNYVCGGRPTQRQKDLLKEASETLFAAMDHMKPGVSTADIARAWPTEAGKQEHQHEFMAHGIGLTNGDMPLIFPAMALKYPVELKENMVLAVETFAGEPDEGEGVRLEEMGIVTPKGFELIGGTPFDAFFGQ